MQIINQHTLSWSHFNKSLLTQWQLPNESINALTSNSIFQRCWHFCVRSIGPGWLPYLAGGEGFLVAGPTACMRCTVKTHTHAWCCVPAALASRWMSITASERRGPFGKPRWQLLDVSGPLFLFFSFFLLMTRLKKYLMLTAISSDAHQQRKTHLKMVPCY